MIRTLEFASCSVCEDEEGLVVVLDQLQGQNILHGCNRQDLRIFNSLEQCLILLESQLVLVLELTRHGLYQDVQSGQLSFVAFSDEHMLKEGVEGDALDGRCATPLKGRRLAEIASTSRWWVLRAKLARRTFSTCTHEVLFSAHSSERMCKLSFAVDIFAHLISQPALVLLHAAVIIV